MTASFRSSVYDACMLSQRVFVLNPRFRRANFYSQQLRVLALVREMFERGNLVHDRDSLIVIGGGIAGMTAAAAALTGGVTVTLVENNGHLDRYAESEHRELHPNVIAWPFQSLRAVTNLPFLNWSCAPAPTVVKRILEQWKSDFAPKVSPIKDQAKVLHEHDNRVEVECVGGNRPQAHAVIIAVGWEQEFPCGSFRSPSYWVPPSFEPPDPVTVSGTGDGGLIDSAYQTYGRKTVTAARALAYALDKKPHKAQIREAEQAALAEFDGGNETAARERLSTFYSMFRLEREDADLLVSYQRPVPMKSDLVHDKPLAFEPTSSPINKVLVSTLTHPPSNSVNMAHAELKERPGGHIVAVSASGEKQIDKARLLVRHGAQHAAWRLLSDAQTSMIKAVALTSLTAVVPDEYDVMFFALRPKRCIAPSPKYKKKELAVLTNKLLNDLLVHASGGEHDFAIKRLNTGQWTVRAGNSMSVLESLFPINGESINVKLISEQEQPRSRYKAPA
jgi:hypothetical protein